MFDFRYHALSLAAVFLALAVGLLLGVAIGDQELVSSAKNDIRESLRQNVREANAQANDLRDELRRERRYTDRTYPILTGGRLDGQRVGIVVLGGDGSEVEQEIDEALGPTGAEIGVVAVVRDAVDRTRIAGDAEGTRYTRLAREPDLLRDFGHRMGVQMVQGGRLVERVRRGLLRSLSGTFGRLDAVILMRAPSSATGERARERNALLEGIVRGMTDTGAVVVGVERSDTDPSQVPWYRDRDLSSVDDVDHLAGHTALVYLLAGADGTYGTKRTAQALLPPVAQPSRDRVRERR